MFFKKKEKDADSLKLEQGSVFVKNDKVPSTFDVEKVLDFQPAPMHVRLKEQGGNGRTEKHNHQKNGKPFFHMQFPPLQDNCIIKESSEMVNRITSQ